MADDSLEQALGYDTEEGEEAKEAVYIAQDTSQEVLRDILAVAQNNLSDRNREQGYDQILGAVKLAIREERPIIFNKPGEEE